MTIHLHSCVDPFARLEVSKLGKASTRKLTGFASRMFSTRTLFNLQYCRNLPRLIRYHPTLDRTGLRAFSLGLQKSRLQEDGPIETASPGVRTGVALRNKLYVEQGKDRVRFSSDERRIDVFRRIEEQIGKHEDMYLAMKDNYDKYIPETLPDFVSLECDDMNEKFSRNMEEFFETGLEVCHKNGRLKHISGVGGVQKLKPSEFAVVIGLGIKQRYLQAIERSQHPQAFLRHCRDLAMRMCEFEIGVLCCDVRTMNATGMLGNRIFRNDEGLVPDLYARQIMNTLYISHLMEKYSSGYGMLFYHFGSEANVHEQLGSAYRITDLPDNKRQLLLSELDKSGKKEDRKTSFTADHIVYASLHKPNTDEFRWVSCYRGEFLLEIVNPQKGILTDGIGPSRALETGFSMDTRFEVISVDRSSIGNLDGSLKYHARLKVQQE